MKYQSTGKYRVDFTAYAPMHTFKGQTTKGIHAEIDIDFERQTIRHARACADVNFFTTGDSDRTAAMKEFMTVERFPEAAVEMAQCRTFEKIDDTRFRVSVLAVLEFMGVRRQLPVSFTITLEKKLMRIDLSFKWSFSAYGIKAPRLLFLTVRDIVDIKGTGDFFPAGE